MTTVMCFGTFDLLHAGHAFYFQQAQQHGDRLIVVVSRDGTVEHVKGKRPMHDEQQRLAAVRARPEVDAAVLGNPGDKLAIILEHKPDVLCLGYDQSAFTDQLKERLAAHGLFPQIIRISAHFPEKYNTTKLLAKLTPSR